jgi:hypothetical protein
MMGGTRFFGERKVPEKGGVHSSQEQENQISDGVAVIIN